MSDSTRPGDSEKWIWLSLSLASAPALSHPACSQTSNKEIAAWVALFSALSALSPTSREKLLHRPRKALGERSTTLKPVNLNRRRGKRSQLCEDRFRFDEAREGGVRIMARVQARVWIRMRRVAQENRLTSAPNVIQFLFSPGLSQDHYSLPIDNMNTIRRREHKLTSSKERANSLVIRSLITSKPMCRCYLGLCYLLSVS